MMDTEDFSFPRICDTHGAHTIDSPPLWNLSPAASPPNPYQGNDCLNRKSFSCVENTGSRKRIGFDFDDDDDEKMDLLWQDLNEELSSTKTTTTTTGVFATSSSSSSREVVEFRSCVPASSKVSNKGKDGTTVPNRMVVIVKVLKKLFSSVNNSQRKQTIRRVR